MKILVNTLQIDLLRRHIGPFLFVFTTIMFLLLMQFLILYIDHIIGKGLPLLVILELIASNLAYMVVLAAPMSVLVSTLMVFGGFSESNEYTVVRSSGIHPFRMVLPVAIAAFILMVGMMLFSNYILPEANYRARALFLDIRKKKPGFDLKQGVFYNGIDGYVFLVNQIDGKTDSLRDITLFQERRNGKDEALIKADRGYLYSIEGTQALALELFDGEMFRTIRSRSDASQMIEKSLFQSYFIHFDLSKLAFSRSNPESRGRNDKTMRAEAMIQVIEKLSDEQINEKTKAYNQNGSPDLNIQKELAIENDSIKLAGIPARLLPKLQKRGNSKSSEFIVIRNQPNYRIQRNVLQNAIRGLRARVVNYDGIKNTIKWKSQRKAKYWVEVWKKLSIPFGCFLFVFIGAPLGMLTKKGNLGVAAVLSAIIFTFYWIGTIQGEKLADRLFIDPFIGMWGINAVYLVFGLFLMLRIHREKWI